MRGARWARRGSKSVRAIGSRFAPAFARRARSRHDRSALGARRPARFQLPLRIRPRLDRTNPRQAGAARRIRIRVPARRRRPATTPPARSPGATQVKYAPSQPLSRE
ncbi:hypothetical protein WS78_02095 [Burkholderia savannae]|nr:hypothetical protein WS78_02095 [Burkholderia savannae]